MKKILITFLVLIVCSSLALSAAPKKKATGVEFHKGDKFLTPQVGFNSWGLPFGANFELAITENIGVGGTVMLWFWNDFGYSESVIAPSAEVAYHFTELKVSKLDLSAGGGLGFAIYNSDFGTGSSSIYPFILLNGRYFFKPNIALNLRFNISFGTWGSAGGLVGVTFRI
jgi:hypothetical protein